MKNKLPTIDIKGKQYVMVKDRLIAFQELYPDGSIDTQILHNDANSVVVRATVRTTQGIAGRAFTGHSEAYREGQMGNVPVEVAETSAVGRALAMLGIGIIESVASADEVRKADKPFFRADTMSAKPISPKQKELIMTLLISAGKTMSGEEIDKLNSFQASQKINELKGVKFTESNSMVKARDSVEQEFNDDPPAIDYE